MIMIETKRRKNTKRNERNQPIKSHHIKPHHTDGCRYKHIFRTSTSFHFLETPPMTTRREKQEARKQEQHSTHNIFEEGTVATALTAPNTHASPRFRHTITRLIVFGINNFYICTYNNFQDRKRGSWQLLLFIALTYIHLSPFRLTNNRFLAYK